MAEPEESIPQYISEAMAALGRRKSDRKRNSSMANLRSVQERPVSADTRQRMQVAQVARRRREQQERADSVRDELIRLFLGDCAKVMAGMAATMIDAIITDPPAGIRLTDASWDAERNGRLGWTQWLAGVMREAYRIAKPGAYGAVWALPRQSHWTACAMEDAGWKVKDILTHHFGTGFPHGDNLKPGSEFWILIQKPRSEASIQANVERWGTGQLQIAECRVAGDRWPINAAFTHAEGCGAVCAPDCAVGRLNATGGSSEYFPTFLYHPKVSRRERNQGCNHLPGRPQTTTARRSYNDRCASCGRKFIGSLHSRCVCPPGMKITDKTSYVNQNPHPTVKATGLMRYLVRLLCPPGGIVLDMFAGSGTTGIACVEEGFGFVGIEQDDEYCDIAKLRIAAAARRPK